MQNKSVKGLANIGALIARTDIPVQAPKRERNTANDITNRTIEKVRAATGGGTTGLVTTYVQAAIREAYNLGHADALDQNSQVERLLEKQYAARTQLTMPAVCAAVMEQKELPSMTLDLALMATVFDRMEISYTVSDEAVIEYTLRPLGEPK